MLIRLVVMDIKWKKIRNYQGEVTRGKKSGRYKEKNQENIKEYTEDYHSIM